MNFTNKRYLAMVLSLMGAMPAWADCVYPKRPDDPPSGAKATQQEMIAAMKATRQFDADVKEYQACLDTETETILNALGDRATSEEIKRVKDKQTLKAVAAYEDAAKVAEAFNQQLRLYKSK